MKQKFLSWNPANQSMILLGYIDRILNDYRKQGYVLTLRQLYYQLVSADIIPNRVSSYTMLGNVVSRGRMGGYIDWDMIEDRTRQSKSNAHWDDPKDILEAAKKQYYRDRWDDQESYIEVWCEKDAVSNIIAPICKKWDVTFMANRGYSSLSAMYDAFHRLNNNKNAGKSIAILYLGDHDPSGIDMVNDIKNRLGTFLYGNEKINFESVHRIALNMDQVEEYKPPKNPAKTTDSRYKAYSKRYGKSSWELDALKPQVLAKIVEDKILEYVDKYKFNNVKRLEDLHKIKIDEMIRNFDDEDI